ncbi:MAG: ferrous iron transport protein B, partial [Planctomycetes bacterium]|nr:ferrous iron transport protein B [Planctomycetota bacterium]
LLLTYLTFQFTFAVGHAPTDWIEALFGWLSGAVAGLWPAGSESALRDLLCDSVIAGVGGVITFVPYILLLFLAIAFLEDTGYMARAAFLMDHLMHKIGLHGKSFIPMLIGFGCSVPAILATRTLDSRRDRLTTMLVVPLMSCSARFVIYTVIVGAFFADRVLLNVGPFALRLQPVMYFLIYLIGVVLAVLAAKLLRMAVLRGETAPLVMELPPYRMPTLRGLAIHMWERGWLYVKKAGTVILALSIILWALTTYPKKTEFSQDYAGRRAKAEQMADPAAREAELTAIEHAEAAERLAYSAAGRIGKAIEPALRPLGFDWRIGTALIGAFAAKEAFVAQMGIVYAVGAGEADREALRQHLRQDYPPLVGFCIMLFCLVSMPCVATIAATRRESGSWRWALLQLGGLTALAYLLTLLTYQLGRLLGLGV